MANIKSAKKRIKVIETKTMHNKAIKSQVKSSVKKVLVAVEAGDVTEAKASLQTAIGEINKAKSKGIFHPKTASRKVSRLTKFVNKMEA